MKVSSKQSISFLVPVLISLSVILYSSTFHLFPAFIHSWTQSDRYAVALSFLTNGFDFFHPATFNLQTIQGITRIDFPVNEYIVALLMKLFGTTAPIVFRLYTLLVSIIGLVYLYLLAKKITSSELKSWLIVLFVFLSPVYVYYQAGFLPGIPAISCVFIAYYYFYLYKNNSAAKHFLISILFFTLAALMRMPFVIFLFAIVLQQGWMSVMKREVNYVELFISLFAFFIFAGYYFYNIHIGRLYGNMFLDYLMPAKNVSELKEILKEMVHHWGLHYFTIWHYFLLLFLISFNFILFIKHRIISEANKTQWFNLFIISCGTVLYFLVMAKQYYAHDYYFLDSFFIPVVFLFIYLLANLPLHGSIRKMCYGIVFLSFSLLFLISSKTIQAERYTSGPWDRTEITRQNFIGADKYLDSMGIAKDAKILVIDAYTTNVPLLLMNRRGYTVLGTSYKNISTSLFWCKWDYVAIQDVYLISDVIKNYPLLTSLVEKVGGTGTVSFYKRSKELKSKTIKQFLHVTPENTLYSAKINFDEPVADSIHITGSQNTSTAAAYSLPAAGVVDSAREYGATVVLKAAELKNIAHLEVLVNGQVWCSQKFADVQLVVSVTSKTGTLFYQNFMLSEYLKPASAWQQMAFQFVLPAFETPEDELKIYLWNPKKALLFYDDYEVVIYK